MMPNEPRIRRPTLSVETRVGHTSRGCVGCGQVRSSCAEAAVGGGYLLDWALRWLRKKPKGHCFHGDKGASGSVSTRGQTEAVPIVELMTIKDY
jgi:hypothetical protein